jgi:GNAT superfamily N-acetyltransferase
MSAAALPIRPWSAADSVEALTALLHRAYARLAAMGLNYTAVDQAPELTARRIASGQCFVVEREGSIVGTVTVNGPFDPQRSPWSLQTPWYQRADCAHFHQLAVAPEAQGQRLGDRLVECCENWARERGFAFMACDTALPATHLRARYRRLGYREDHEVQWEGKTYRSVILVKEL